MTKKIRIEGNSETQVLQKRTLSARKITPDDVGEIVRQYPEKSMKAIAETINLSPGQVSSVLHDLRKKGYDIQRRRRQSVVDVWLAEQHKVEGEILEITFPATT